MYIDLFFNSKSIYQNIKNALFYFITFLFYSFNILLYLLYIYCLSLSENK